MRIYIGYIFFLSTVAINLFAQVTVGGLTRDAIDLNTRAGGVMMEIKPPIREAVGSTYLDDNWLPGKVEFANGHVLDNILLRYDISIDQIEVRIDGVVRGVKGQNAKSFTIFNPTDQSNDFYANASVYQEVGIKHTGFFKVVATGEWSLLEKIVVTFVKPSYNPVLDVGEEEPKYVKSSTLYIAQNNSINTVSKSKKKFLESLNERADATAAYMKKMSLSLKKKEDVKLIVDFLNKKI